MVPELVHVFRRALLSSMVPEPPVPLIIDGLALPDASSIAVPDASDIGLAGGFKVLPPVVLLNGSKISDLSGSERSLMYKGWRPLIAHHWRQVGF
jgi:hypothetical protein